MTTFASDFWPLAKGWRGSHGNPRKGRGGAEPAWDKCIKEGADPEQIIIGARGYLAHIEKEITDLSKVCQAVTFLNQWRWEQYVDLAIETEKREAEELLERRRKYWRYGQRDALQGVEPRVIEDFMGAEVIAAYDQGYANGKGDLARPELRVVG